jgi:hypothetical protein
MCKFNILKNIKNCFFNIKFLFYLSFCILNKCTETLFSMTDNLKAYERRLILIFYKFLTIQLLIKLKSILVFDNFILGTK